MVSTMIDSVENCILLKEFTDMSCSYILITEHQLNTKFNSLATMRIQYKIGNNNEDIT